jgi:2-keto-4-pentenoate hydratase/2-oxohepta-3-ene-1,7-dioic acid hydratase in catechol pathway
VRIVRFRIEGKTRYGVLDGAAVVEYAGTPWSLFRRGRRRYPLRQVVLLAPVLPSKIVGIGFSHREHTAGLGRPGPDDPLVFFKPISALVGPDDPIVAPPQSKHVECEAALAVVIKRRCRNVPAARAREYVLGYAGLNDVIARDLQARDGDWTRAKAFDTFCPVGPCIATDLDPHAATLETWVNGTLRASASTTGLVFAVEDVLARVSEIMTLLPGDVIAAGAPGVSGPVDAGDRVEIRIEGVGALKNTVVRL